MPRHSTTETVFNEIEAEIWEVYDRKKEEVLGSFKRNDAETCLQQISGILAFMNRFRNCSLRFYFDEELHSIIAGLNKHRYDTSHLLRPKKEFRIAFVFSRFNDAGGAAFTHRYILEDYPGSDYTFKQYVLVANMTNTRSYEQSERYQYMRDRINIEEFHFMEPNDSLVEKGRFIQEWLYERGIDFAVVQPNLAALYAISSRPVLIDATFSADWYTFTLGPGTGDFTFLMTTDQVFKYSFSEPDFERRIKNIRLPLPPMEYVNDAVPMTKSELGLPEDAVVSATTNMWKCCFGDDETLLEGIATLIRRFPNYHHLFIGTPRCLDSVDFFLSKNKDIQENIHYVGIHPYIYRLLKLIDFFVNSYPVSGASNTEAALCGKPSIDLFSDRDLAGHSCELLRSFECEVVSLDEFVALGTRFISEPEYRDDLGRYLQKRMVRELGKPWVVKERIYDMFVSEFERRLAGRERLKGLRLERTLTYEKGLAMYNAYGRDNWSPEKRRLFLDSCVKEFPERSFGWVKSLEEAIQSEDREWFMDVFSKLVPGSLQDHRVHVMLALGFKAFRDGEKALEHALKAVDLAVYDKIPARVAARLLLSLGRPGEAARVLSNALTDRGVGPDDAESVVAELPPDDLPLYYNY